ncbi:MAG: phosphoribosylglycinamide formyltransferase [Spirochaetales bacterium]|nr:phosphoribosylglycinamide formyltransferase [Spirochaetales bacterium]
MGSIAVFASGGGSNFEAIARRLEGTQHSIALLVCDRKAAYVHERAKALHIPVVSVSYVRNTREEVEHRLIEIIDTAGVDFIVLAGFMRLLTPLFVERFSGKIVNIHPALLPKYPGTRGIEESWESGDEKVGITIHYVDKGMDTGPVILQKEINRIPGESLEAMADRIHCLEHTWYPDVIFELLERQPENFPSQAQTRREKMT